MPDTSLLHRVKIALAAARATLEDPPDGNPPAARCTNTDVHGSHNWTDGRYTAWCPGHP